MGLARCESPLFWFRAEPARRGKISFIRGKTTGQKLEGQSVGTLQALMYYISALINSTGFWYSVQTALIDLLDNSNSSF